jgi:hypothetical protein
MTALYYLLPVAKVIPFPYAGTLFIVFGLAIMLIAVGAFSRAKTPIIPFERSTALVVDGMYQFTRNPMYPGAGADLCRRAIWRCQRVPADTFFHLGHHGQFYSWRRAIS